MSTYTTDKASPFTRAVISSMRRLYESDASLSRAGDRLMDCPTYRYPEALADQSFDNTGCKFYDCQWSESMS